MEKRRRYGWIRGRGHALLLFFFLFFSVSSLTAGRLAPSSPKTLKTTYFDITYGEEGASFASDVASYADALYEEACTYLQTEPYMRHIPIAITTRTDEENSYFTTSPANKIVLYAVPFSYPLGSVFSDTEKGVFSHELFHLVSINQKEPFYRVVDTVLGDGYTPIYYVASSSILEGSAVLFESRKGEGRLNSPLYQAKILEAKREGKFPVSYLDATGLRDTSPSGDLTYTFSGAFLSFVREKYGSEAYNQFLHSSANMLLPVDFTVWYHDAFDAWPQDDWNAYKASLPEVDVVEAAVSDLSVASDRLLASHDGKLLTYSSRGGDVRLDGKLLFRKSGVRSAYCDGERLLVCSSDSSFATDVSISLYDMEHRKWTSICPSHGVEAVFMGENIAYVDHQGTRETLHVDGNSIPLPFSVHSLVGLDENRLAALASVDGKLQIVMIDCQNRSYHAYALPDGCVPYSLAKDDSGLLMFSWGKKGTLLRMGRMDGEGMLSLMGQDIPGGVEKVVSSSLGIVVQRPLFDHTVLSLLDDSFLSFETLEAGQSTGSLDVPGSVPVSGEKYNPWPYLLKGTILPANNVVQVKERGSVIDTSSTSYAIGAFRMSGDLYGDSSLTYGVGYDITRKTGVVTGQFVGTFRPLNAIYAIDGQYAFDGSFWTRFYFRSIYGNWRLLSQTEWFGVSSLQGIEQDVALSWNTIRLRRSGVWSKGGFAFTPGLSYRNVWPGDWHFANLSLTFKVAIPALLPFFDSPSHTCNLPVVFTTYVMPSQYCVLAQNIDLILYSQEIQRGTPWIHFYFRRFTLEATYDGAWYDQGRGDFPLFKIGETLGNWAQVSSSHKFSLSAYFTMSLNNRTNDGNGKLGVSLSYGIGKENPWSVTFAYSVLSFDTI